MSNNNKKLRSQSSLKSRKDTSSHSNQRKSYVRSISPIPVSSKNSTIFSENIFKHPEMKKYILKVQSNKFKFYCDYCLKMYGKIKEINVDSLKNHIMSDKHDIAVPKEKKLLHEKVKALYTQEGARNSSNKSNPLEAKVKKGFDEKNIIWNS